MARLIRMGLESPHSPLRVTGTSLPPAVLLAVKVMALAFLLHNQLQALPAPFLSFVPGLDSLPAGGILPMVLQAACLGAGLCILFNLWPRLSSLVLGTAILIAILSSRTYLENNRFFTGSFLFLAGLYSDRFGLSLLRAQVIVLYFGATLNKFLEPDWRNGQFFVAFGQVSGYHSVYAMIPDSVFPIIGWSVILTEAAIFGGLLLPALRRPAVWLAVGYHTSLLMISGRTFGLFWFALLASFAVFLDWPVRSGEVVFNPASAWRLATASLHRLDIDRIFQWTSSPVATLTVLGKTTHRRGFAGLLTILLNSPWAYLAFVAVVAPLPEHFARLPALLVLAVLGLLAADAFLRRLRPLLVQRRTLVQVSGSRG